MPYFKLALEETPRYQGAPVVAPYRVSTIPFYFPLNAGMLALSPAHLDRRDELRGNLSPPPMLIDGYAPSGRISERAYANTMLVLYHLAGLEMTVQAGAGTNEVQTLSITGSPTGGSFTLTFGAQTTAAIPWNATAAQVDAALELLSTIGEGNVLCAGGPLPGSPITITFVGALAATNVALITDTSSLTGGTTPDAAVAETTPGAPGAVLDPDGKGIPTGAFLWTSAKRSGATAKSAQIIEAFTSEGVFLYGEGFGASQVAMDAAGAFSAELMGLYIRNGADPVLTPAYDSLSVYPFRRGDIRIEWGSGSTFIDDFSFQVNNPIERGEDLGIQSYFPKTLDHTGDVTSCTGNIARRRIIDADWDALAAASTFAAEARWISPSKIGSSGYRYSVWNQIPSCQHTGGDADEMKNARRFGARFDWFAGYDDAAGYDFRISMVNGLSAIETYA